MTDPFSVFPELVWEMILNLLRDSKDVHNVLLSHSAFGESVSIQKRKSLWLMGEVLPLLIDIGMDEKDVVKCRQVYKQWRFRIDYFLEKQHTLQAYNPELHDEIKDYWDPTLYLTRYGTDRTATKRDYFGGVAFPIAVNSESIIRFGEDMEEINKFVPSLHLNPFLSRSVKFIITGAMLNRGLTWEAGSILQRFGGEVWYLTLDFRMGSDPNHSMSLARQRPWFWNELTQRWIGSFPNLKSFRLMGGAGRGGNDLDINLDGWTKAVRPLGLRHLETLRLNYDQLPFSVAGALLSSYAEQIRRLELPLRFWETVFTGTFPNLTELEIVDIKGVPREEGKTKAKLNNLITSLNSPNLVKLQLKFTYKLTLEIEEVFQWMKLFPSIKYLNVGESCRFLELMEVQEGDNVLYPEWDTIRSLEFLGIEDSPNISYDFLRCLPSLRHLQIFTCRRGLYDLGEEPIPVPEREVRIREEIKSGEMYKSNIWEILPQLKSVSVLVEDRWENRLVNDHRFERATYEYLRQTGGI